MTNEETIAYGNKCMREWDVGDYIMCVSYPQISGTSFKLGEIYRISQKGECMIKITSDSDKDYRCWVNPWFFKLYKKSEHIFIYSEEKKRI